MFQRNISTHEVEYIIENGETIHEYPEDLKMYLQWFVKIAVTFI